MLVKTSELTGAALDWAVAKCEGKNPSLFIFQNTGKLAAEHRYSTDWSQGGPIIERESINLRSIRKEGHSMDGQWLAAYDGENTGSIVQWVKRTDWPRHYLSGPTPLIAAMRCYVTSKLGDTVEIPNEVFA